MNNIDNMFFNYRYISVSGDTIKISSGSQIKNSKETFASNYLLDTISKCTSNGIKYDICLYEHIPDDIIKQLGEQYKFDEENYALRISSADKKVDLCASSHRGLIYAVSTLKQLIEADCVKDMILFDYPDKRTRGYRLYTPGKNQINDFKKLIDELVYYKYNSVIIEVGGAMEYKKHPEINAKWCEFCAEIMESPERAMQIELYTYPWAKDSIHFENGEGGFISQDEMRDIVEYCKEREIEVIPEVPSLSHSDYIVMAHPDLAERQNDDYPDTYCPSNPKTYDILFDIIDEVVDVFEPKFLNIGHDEFYSACHCERCQGKKAVDLFVDDVIIINDYLKSKNISAYMWCDKLFEDITFCDYDGLNKPFGASPDPCRDVCSVIGCKNRLPRDITMLHWCYMNATKEEEDKLCELGYKMVYGNYSALLQENYRERSAIADGGFYSNWGYISDEYMQRNMQTLSLVCNAFVFWSCEYDDDMRDEVYSKSAKILYENYKRSLDKNIIEICHSTTYHKEHFKFWCGNFIVPEDWHLGDYVVDYSDGSEARLPVIYGWNIYCENEGNDTSVKIGADSKCNEALGASLPYIDGGKIRYCTAFSNPYPEKKVEKISYMPIMEAQVTLLKWDFCNI
ncbi:MAG: family 20 glycosylhydrolase [Clostridia bacterium]|nr:family 20 glycosylhydrolase [Clostridia bacterium]